MKQCPYSEHSPTHVYFLSRATYFKRNWTPVWSKEESTGWSGDGGTLARIGSDVSLIDWAWWHIPVSKIYFFGYILWRLLQKDHTWYDSLGSTVKPSYFKTETKQIKRSQLLSELCCRAQSSWEHFLIACTGPELSSIFRFLCNV